MSEKPRPRIAYLWERHVLRRLEIFQGKTDLDKMPEIPEHSSLRQRLINLTDKKERRKK
jgi:hypothetical protein